MYYGIDKNLAMPYIYIMKTRWTNEEVAMLKELYPVNGYNSCKGKILRSRNAINHMAHRLNILLDDDVKSKIFSESGIMACLAYSGPGELNPNWKGGISKNNYRYKLRMKEKYPEKYKARSITAGLVRSGKIIKTPCVICGDTNSQAHHQDYSKPENVVWLCRKHHNELHLALNTP